ncbi:MAG: glycosyltransferase family 2 protein [Erysipelotrichaceae bacterium]
MKRLAIVVPCYNEEEVFKTTNIELGKVLNELIKDHKISKNSFILYVNDGSKDSTWALIKEAHQDFNYVQGLNLAGNKGHQNALYAGLMQAKEVSDFTISIDADLQDDIQVIKQMVDCFNQGKDIVYGVRDDRSSDSMFKRVTAQVFYKLMNFLGAETIYNHADFRLMSKRAVDELSLYEESYLYLRGIVPQLGFQTDCVYYARKPRMAGESKYPFKKMLSFAFNGITSFSIKPLTLILYLGFASIMISMIAVVYSFVRHFQGQTVTGWSSTFISIWFLGGVQLASIGVLGQYIGKNFIESKKRPRYYVESYLGEKQS